MAKWAKPLGYLNFQRACSSEHKQWLWDSRPSMWNVANGNYENWPNGVRSVHELRICNHRVPAEWKRGEQLLLQQYVILWRACRVHQYCVQLCCWIQGINIVTPSPPTKSFPTKSPRVKLSGRLPIELYGHENFHPLDLRVCLSQTLWNPNS